MTFLRRFWNRLGVKAVPRLCHADITDRQSGFRLIRTEVLKEIALFTSRFETELELLIKACKKGLGVLSVPIKTQQVDGTGPSHFRPVADTWMVCGAPRAKPVAPTLRPSGATSRPKAMAFCCRGKLFLRSLFW
jgi:hypothetical protein